MIDEEYELNVPASETRRRRQRNTYTPEKISRSRLIEELGLSEAEVNLASLSDEEIHLVIELVECNFDKYRAWRMIHPDEMVNNVAIKKVNAILKRDDVRKVLRMAVVKNLGMTMDNLDSQLLQTYVTRAFYDIADYHDSQGLCLPLHLIPAEKRCAIDRIETRYYGKDGDVLGVNYILANREKALDTLRDYLKDVRGSVDVPVTDVSTTTEDDLEDAISSMTDEELKAEMRKLG